MLLLPSGIGGAFLGLAVFQLGEGGNRFAGILVGWLYGISVAGLIRLLPVSPGWYWLAGIFAGPIPIALLLSDGTPAGERGVIVVGAAVGGLLGLLETAHWRLSMGVRDHALAVQVVPPEKSSSS
ncbi:MAG: hypothetical protein EXS08_10025 [Planctomycetes bacterium]|nr:hypothetical protein [Planctomycetota bacterium]